MVDDNTSENLITERVASRAAEVLGTDPIDLSLPGDVMVSPVWRGVEGDVWFASGAGRTIAIKRFNPEASFYVDFESVVAMTGIAGRLGVGPAVLASFAEDRVLVMDRPVGDWRVGGLHDTVSEPIRRSIIEAKAKLKSGSDFPVRSSVLAEIPKLAAEATARGATLPPRLDVWLESTAELKAAVDALGVDSVPCHRDGNTSNLLVNDKNEVLLLDFDLAANADPYEDCGCYLREMFDCEPESRDGFMEWHSYWDEGLYERSMLYGQADDLRWGLIAATMQAVSPHRSREYSKYASWRFLRYEYTARRASAADRLRRMR